MHGLIAHGWERKPLKRRLLLHQRRSLIAPVTPQRPPDIAPKKRRTGSKRDDFDCLRAAARGLEFKTTYADNDSPSIRWPAAALLVRDRAGAERFLRANPAQVAFERHRGRCNIILKARQMGITTWIAGRFFLKTIMNRGVLSVQVAHTQDAAESIFETVKRFWNCLDEEEQTGPFARSVANVHTMRFAKLDSEFRVLSAADGNAGRGLSIQNLHCSEVSRWPGNASETLAGLRAALAPGGELILESTPNGAYGCFHEEWIKAVDPVACATALANHELPESTLIRHFFPWWLEPAYADTVPAADLSPEEEELMHKHHLTREQIGFRRGLESSYRRLRSQEFAEDHESCFRATGDCCFDIESIDNRLAELGDPVETDYGGALQIWLPYQPGKEYIVAVDTAGGGENGDYAAIQVIEKQLGLQCAELQQKVRPLDLARVAVELANQYGGAIIAVERNNHGSAVIACLQSVERYFKLYCAPGRHASASGHSRSENSPDDIGWLTTAASKPFMVALMGELLIRSPRIFFSRRLLAECRTFISASGGRTGAAGGAHDDCFMAMAVAQSVRSEMLAGKKVL